MANKAIKLTSGFGLRSEEKAEMQQESKETSSTSSDVGTQLLSRFRTIDSSEFDGSSYIGEGNATLVVSLPHERKVLRFRKSEEDNGAVSAKDDGKMRAELLVDFFKNVISGLMGTYASEPEIVRCNPEDVALWMSRLETQRPEHRCHKKVANTYATTLPDYTLLPGYLHDKLPSAENRPTFCVEIKPKQGFVEEQVSLLRGKCDYCRKQYSKLAEGKIPATSKYCPLDLFSGDEHRMRRAVRGLADSPQNNFRIFKNGRLIWGENFEPKQLDIALAEWFFHDKQYDREAAHESMFQLIYKALLRPFSQIESNSVSIATGEQTNEALGQTLPNDSVLERILRVQRLNKHNVEFVYDIYSKYSKILNDEMIYFKAKTKLLEQENLQESKLVPSNDELLILRNYLLFRLAKDCSILMAFQELDSSAIPDVPADNVIQISESRYFLFNAAITDLDPKSVDSIAKHYRRRTAEISKVTNQIQGA